MTINLDADLANADWPKKTWDKFKLGAEGSIKKQKPPRPGLVPQSGDPEHPVRWVRPREAFAGRDPRQRCGQASLEALGVCAPPGEMTIAEALQYVEEADKDWDLNYVGEREGYRVKVGDLDQEFPTGQYLVLAQGHLMALTDGALTDVGRTHSDVPVEAVVEIGAKLEKLDKDCPPGLEEKPIIDRLGRHSHRCVREQDFDTAQEHRALMRGMPSVEAYAVILDKLGLKDYDGPIDIEETRRVVLRTREEMGVKSSLSSLMYNVMADWDTDVLEGEARYIQSAITLIKEGSSDRAVNTLEELGVDPRVDEDPSRFQRAAVDLNAMMQQEQAYWKSKGVTSLTLYRGVGGEQDLRDQLGLESGDHTTIVDLPASSWSLYPSVAEKFGGTVLAREVPIEQVITSTFGGVASTLEGEFILYTPEEGVEVQVV